MSDFPVTRPLPAPKSTRFRHAGHAIGTALGFVLCAALVIFGRSLFGRTFGLFGTFWIGMYLARRTGRMLGRGLDAGADVIERRREIKALRSHPIAGAVAIADDPGVSQVGALSDASFGQGALSQPAPE